jgi:hypothetical protein
VTTAGPPQCGQVPQSLSSRITRSVRIAHAEGTGALWYAAIAGYVRIRQARPGLQPDPASCR